MKLPSLRYAADHASRTFHRFPLVVLAGVTCAVMGILAVEYEIQDAWFLRLSSTCGLALPLFFALGVYRESPHARFNPPRAVLWAGGAVFLGAFYWLSPAELTEGFFLRYAQWSLVLHMLAAFAPFTAPGGVNGFWQYNRRLFLRFCVSGLYAAVFFVGLALALGAVKNLLDVKVHEKLFAELWMFAAFVLQPWHFAAGVPEDIQGLERDDSYPAGLKVFVQYLLIPLSVIYAGILYIYMGKILATRVWPKGMVTGLVSGLAVFGMLTLLLVDPVKEREENRWLKVYAKGFYFALFPLLAMLFAAVYKRLAPYGVTEQRYFVVVLAAWIGGIAAYFLVGRKNIKAVPVSLCLVAMATSFGPWGAYGMSRWSQSGQLKALLVKDGMWTGDKARKAPAAVPAEDEARISSILDYLVRNHGLSAVRRWFDADLTEFKPKDHLPSHQASLVSTKICQSLGISYRNRWDVKTSAHFNFYSYASVPPALEVRGYERFVRMAGPGTRFSLEGSTWTVRGEGGVWEVAPEGQEPLRFDLAALADRLKKEGVQPGTPILIEKMTAEAETAAWAGRLCLESLSGKYPEDGGKTSANGNGFLFLRKKR